MKDQKRAGGNHVIKLMLSQPLIINFSNGHFNRCTKENIAKGEHRKDAVCLTFILYKYKNTDDTHPRACLILD